MFVAKAGASHVMFQYKGKLLALPENICAPDKKRYVENALAYFASVFVTKSVIMMETMVNVLIASQIKLERLSLVSVLGDRMFMAKAGAYHVLFQYKGKHLAFTKMHLLSLLRQA